MSTEQLLLKLADLHKQATKERSHFYVGSILMECATALMELEDRLTKLNAKVFLSKTADWRSIAIAPRDGTEVLLGWDYGELVLSGHWHSFRGRDEWTTSRGPYAGRHDPTHWMPIPEPPK